jgi:hypothetical protein
MSAGIQSWQVNQFSSNVARMFQQGSSKLRGTVREQVAGGSGEDVWPRIGPAEAVQKLTRGERTPDMSTPLSQRVATLADWEWKGLIDWSDIARILADPRSEVVQNATSALGRRFDRTILAAMDADAFGGEDGNTLTSFVSECAGDHDFSVAAISMPNILELKCDLDNHDVPLDNRHIVIDPSGLKQLLSQSSSPNLNSSDYNAVKALVKGEIDYFCGFTWHKSTLCPIPGGNTDQRYGYAFHYDAIGISISEDISTEVTRRPDFCFSTQVKVWANLGATRLQGEGVSRFKISTSSGYLGSSVS